MVSRTFPATQCPRTMIFTDYAWPCCSHVHQPRHARARRPFEGYACCENKATTAAALYSNRDFFRARRENTKKAAPSSRFSRFGEHGEYDRAFSVHRSMKSTTSSLFSRSRTRFEGWTISPRNRNNSPWRISWKGCICYCGYSQCTVVLTRLRVIGRGNVGVITSRFERACRLSGGIEFRSRAISLSALQIFSRTKSTPFDFHVHSSHRTF